MDKLKAAVLDDESMPLKVISDAIRSAFASMGVVCEVEAFTSAKEFLSKLKQNIYRILFLDIEMPECDGIKLADKLRKAGISSDIVFVTNREDRVWEVFKIQPFGFIRKNSFLTDVTELVKRYVEVADKRDKKNDTIVIPAGGENHVIKTGRILYIQNIGHKQTVYFTNGKPPVEVSLTMEGLEKSLDSSIFYRVHKGFIINLKYVESYSRDGVKLSGDVTVPLNAKKLSEFKRVYLEFASNVGGEILTKNKKQ